MSNKTYNNLIKKSIKPKLINYLHKKVQRTTIKNLKNFRKKLKILYKNHQYV